MSYQKWKYNNMSMRGKKCLECNKGTYDETSIYDDMDGVLHCDKCNHEVKTYADEKSKRKVDFDLHTREVTQTIHLADHEVFISFGDDDNAIAFCDWFSGVGSVEFQKYLDKQ